MISFADAATTGLDRWRKDLTYRNDLVRTVAVDIIRGGAHHVESGIAWLKNFVGYSRMQANEQLLVRKHASVIRRIVSQWSALDDVTQQGFIEGRILPSALHRLLSRPSNAGG